MPQTSPKNSLFHLKAASLLATLLTVSLKSVLCAAMFKKPISLCVRYNTTEHVSPAHAHVLTATYGHACGGHVHMRIYTHID